MVGSGAAPAAAAAVAAAAPSLLSGSGAAGGVGRSTSMPPRAAVSMTSSFSVADANEVVCPLKNQDGSYCRKRCVGEKRYRSMQEHIRRAHPEHYISKLPATEESFMLMINTQPSTEGTYQQAAEQPHQPHQLHQQLPQQQQPQQQGHDLAHTPHSFPRDNHHHHHHARDPTSGPGTPLAGNEYGHHAMHPANAAAALAQLHASHRVERDWDSEGEVFSDTDRRVPRTSIELPPILPSDGSPMDPHHHHNHHNHHHHHQQHPRQMEILPSLLAASSPPGRSSTLPPIQRSAGPAPGVSRARKQSVSKKGREGVHHRKQRSRGTGADIFRRLNEERLRPGNADRKALSAEPSANYGSRWEDLIDAADQAASQAGDLEERTSVPRSPISMHRASLPPSHPHPQPHQHFPPHQQHQQLHHHQQYQQQQQQATVSYQASPLQQALTPPSYNQEATEPFPSVETGDSGENFHMRSRGLLSDSSPSCSSQNTQIYCAACQGISLLRESFACTECICGLCQACVDVLLAEHGARRQCPRCSTIGGKFKPFQLDIR